MGKHWAHILIATCFGSVVAFAEDDTVAPPSMEIVISVAEQKLALIRDGGVVRKYPISTSKFGLGDATNSYKTPLGRLRVCDKVGDNLPIGAVLKSRNATGEILQANAPGRDPIVTRILWLEGLEAGNGNARDRGIYIHGTVEESRLGQPVSYGCIRMRSRDVVELFESTPVGTLVEIVPDRFPSFRRVAPKPEILVASNDRVKTIFGPRGMVSVTTVPRNESPGEKVPAFGKVAPGLLAGKTPEQGAKGSATAPKSVATATPPLPIAEGPTVMLKAAPPAPAEPRVILAMNESILMSGLPRSAKSAPAPKPPVAAPATVEPPVSLRWVVLQVVEPVDLLAAPVGARQARPLDRLSAHLLNPPAPQFRLAFRTNAEPPEL